MKKLLFLICLTFSLFTFSQEKVVATNDCAERGCTGSAYCSACKNCSGCKHCAKMGGTCGVCSGGGSNYKSYNSYTSKKKKSNKKSKSNRYTPNYSRGNKSSVIVVNYYKKQSLLITATVLNVRKGAGTEYPVIAKLKKNDEVQFLESEGNWIKIWIPKMDLEGFVYAKYVKAL